MIEYNKQSKRINPFQKVYDNPLVRKIPKDVPKFPQYVDIEITNKCNLSCRMCPRPLAHRKEGFMEFGVFQKIVDECYEYETPIRIIGFGEPLLHPQFNEMIRYIKQDKSSLLHITTNGLLMNFNIMKTLIDNDVDSIIFSFQGTSAELYKRMRRVDAYSHLYNTIGAFAHTRSTKEKPFIHITTTTTNETKEDKESFVKEWLPLVDAVSVGTTNMALVKDIITDKYVPCTEVYHLVQVDWDGSISPCCGDFDNYLTIGNIKNNSIYSLWNNSKKLEHLRGLLNGRNHKMLNPCHRCIPTYDFCD